MATSQQLALTLIVCLHSLMAIHEGKNIPIKVLKSLIFAVGTNKRRRPHTGTAEASQATLCVR